MFGCDGSVCLALRFFCDDHTDCYDGTDETNCHADGSRIYQVLFSPFCVLFSSWNFSALRLPSGSTAFGKEPLLFFYMFTLIDGLLQGSGNRKETVIFFSKFVFLAFVEPLVALLGCLLCCLAFGNL